MEVPESLTGLTVKIENKDLLQFFYPKYLVKHTLFFDEENKVIYIGKTRKDLIIYLKNNTKEFINTVGKPDINLNNDEVLLSFVYKKWNKKFNKSTEGYLLELDKKELYKYIKYFWITGENLYQFNNKKSSQDIISLLDMTELQIIKSFFETVNETTVDVYERKIIKFLEKTVYFNPNDFRSSKNRDMLIKTNEKLCREELVKILSEYRKMNKDKEKKLLWLILKISSVINERSKVLVN